ncbi:MAG TPA: ribulose phosphate epimerase [Nannocystaceae bacterium]|nr:ribulose phosphate epimerase [Nannocystaceae bacterium]
MGTAIMARAVRIAVLPLALVACVVDSPDGIDDGLDAESSSTAPQDDDDAVGDGSTSAADDEPGDSSSSTADETGEPSGPATCDPWAQDCPEGEKCMPYEADPVDALVWDALGCFPLVANAKQPGDSCTVTGNGVSGIDDCELGAMCMGVDDETLVGVCVAMCEGTAASPRCADTSTTCIIANDGVILVCLPQCDPLVQDCAEGEGCYESGTGGFFCFAQDETAAGDAAYGESCMTLNFCNPGLMCAPASTVPGCTSEYCCTEFCDAALGPEQCAGAAGGQTCTPYFAVDATPPGFDDVGVCAVPQ